MEKNKSKAFGAYAATVAKKLKKSGLTGRALELALAAVKSTPATDGVRIPRRVVRALGLVLGRERRAVVVTGRSGGIKVFSLDGYISAQKSSSALAKRVQPWKASAKKRAAAKPQGAA